MENILIKLSQKKEEPYIKYKEELKLKMINQKLHQQIQKI